MRSYLLQAFVQYDNKTNTGNAAGNVTFDVVHARGANAGQPANVYIDAAGSATVTRTNGKFTTNQYGIFQNQNGGQTYFANGYYSFIFDDADINATNKMIDIPIFAVEDSSETTTGLIRRATTAEAQAGANDVAAMTPLKSLQQANKLGVGLSAVPIKTLASNSEWAINTGDTLFSSGTSISVPVSGLAMYSTNIGRRDASGGYALLSSSFDPSLERFFIGQSLDNVAAPKWSELLHENNLLNCQNVSGGTVTSNSTVAGSSLNPAKPGTWRNIQTSDVPNNSYGIFKRVF